MLGLSIFSILAGLSFCLLIILSIISFLSLSKMSKGLQMLQVCKEKLTYIEGRQDSELAKPKDMMRYLIPISSKLCSFSNWRSGFEGCLIREGTHLQVTCFRLRSG